MLGKKEKKSRGEINVIRRNWRRYVKVNQNRKKQEDTLVFIMYKKFQIRIIFTLNERKA